MRAPLISKPFVDDTIRVSTQYNTQPSSPCCTPKSKSIGSEPPSPPWSALVANYLTSCGRVYLRHLPKVQNKGYSVQLYAFVDDAHGLFCNYGYCRLGVYEYQLCNSDRKGYRPVQRPFVRFCSCPRLPLVPIHNHLSILLPITFVIT